MTIDEILEVTEKATPGPWEYVYEEKGYIFLPPGEQGKLIGEVRGWGWLQKEPNGAEQQYANGKLMAGAPQLAEEVRRLRKELHKATIQSNTYAKRLVNLGYDDVVWYTTRRSQ